MKIDLLSRDGRTVHKVEVSGSPYPVIVTYEGNWYVLTQGMWREANSPVTATKRED